MDEISEGFSVSESESSGFPSYPPPPLGEAESSSEYLTSPGAGLGGILVPACMVKPLWVVPVSRFSAPVLSVPWCDLDWYFLLDTERIVPRDWLLSVPDLREAVWDRISKVEAVE